MRKWKRGICLIVLQCWLPMAVADGTAAGGVGASGPGSTPAGLPNSAEMLRKMDASPQEDYEAGLVAYDRGELIEAQGIFERAANRGNTDAMIELAGILERSGFNSEAADWYRKAAELGNADAQFRFGSMYLDWDAYDKSPSMKLDYASARKWIMLAAEQGHHAAIAIVAHAYAGGGLELTAEERSDVEVMKWIKRAIDVDNADAMDALAGAYRAGKFGLEIDLQQADAWAAKAMTVRGITEKKEKVKKKSRKSRL